MSILTLKAHSDGWELTRSGPADFSLSRFALRGLAVSREQATAILHQRGDREWFRVPVPGGWIMTLGLNQDEALAIWHQGLDPLAVLAPPLYARALSLGELMSVLTAARDGWTLSVMHNSLGRAVRFRLDGLLVTEAQGRALFSCGRPLGAASAAWATGDAGLLDGIELDRREYLAIAGGASPLSVLLPRMYARALSLEEMMTA